MATSSSVVKEIKIIVNDGQATASIDGITVSTKKLNSELAKLSVVGGKGKGGGASGASGGATATVLELGRTISDSNYGIRGMANNISQLASNFLFMSRKVDETTKKAIGFGGALKQTWTAIMGPLGILLAIQGVIALFERWSMQTKETNVQLEVMGKSVTQDAAKIKFLNSVLNDTNMSYEQQKVQVEAARHELEDYGIEVDTSREGLKKLGQSLNILETQLIRTAMAQGYANLLQEQYNDLAELNIGGVIEQIDWYDYLIGALTGVATGIGGANGAIIEGAKDLEKELKLRQEKIDKTMAELKKPLEDGSTLGELLWGTDKENKSNANRAMKIFKAGVLDFEKLILAQKDKELKVGLENEVKLLKISKNTKLMEVMLKFNTFKEKQDIRLKDYLASVEGHKNEAKLVEDAEAKHKESIISGRTEAMAAKVAIHANFNKQIEQQEFETAAKLEEIRTGQALGLVSGAMDVTGDDTSEEVYKAELENAQFESRLALEAERDLALSSGKQERIMSASVALENFDIKVKQDEIARDLEHGEKKRAIAMEYVGFVAQTGQLLGKLAGDNEKLQKAALIADKGVKIAGVVIQTQGAIAARRAGNLMLAASGPLGPKLAAADKIPMARDITRTKIGAALSIANILAAGKGSKSIKDSGGASASGNNGAGDRTFDFNLVGSTGTNQLAEAVGSQFQEPVQAYVVSSQMTSQQELDLQISTGASLGGD